MCADTLSLDNSARLPRSLDVRAALHNLVRSMNFGSNFGTTKEVITHGFIQFRCLYGSFKCSWRCKGTAVYRQVPQNKSYHREGHPSKTACLPHAGLLQEVAWQPVLGDAGTLLPSCCADHISSLPLCRFGTGGAAAAHAALCTSGVASINSGRLGFLFPHCSLLDGLQTSRSHSCKTLRFVMAHCCYFFISKCLNSWKK